MQNVHRSGSLHCLAVVFDLVLKLRYVSLQRNALCWKCPLYGEECSHVCLTLRSKGQPGYKILFALCSHSDAPFTPHISVCPFNKPNDAARTPYGGGACECNLAARTCHDCPELLDVIRQVIITNGESSQRRKEWHPSVYLARLV